MSDDEQQEPFSSSLITHYSLLVTSRAASGRRHRRGDRALRRADRETRPTGGTVLRAAGDGPRAHDAVEPSGSAAVDARSGGCERDSARRDGVVLSTGRRKSI